MLLTSLRGGLLLNQSINWFTTIYSGMIDNSSLSRAVIKFAYFNDMTAHDWYS